ncbi:MAG: transcription termination/antitermination protein NusG [bacterium]
MKQWFIIHVYSGQEQKVMDVIRNRFTTSAPNEEIEIIMPTKKVSKLTKKGTITMEKKLYPGYLVLQVEPKEELIKLISETPGVRSFGGKGKQPQIISEEEVSRMFGYIKPEPGKNVEVPFIKGETVKISTGPFIDFTGVVEEIYPERERLKLMVNILGRQTPVEISFFEVEVM